MATPEAPIHANFKQAIVDSDGHDTVLTEIPDLASQRVWPGAMSRAKRNGFIERWAGREWAIRQNAGEIGKELAKARAAGDIANASLSYGQDAARQFERSILSVFNPRALRIPRRNRFLINQIDVHFLIRGHKTVFIFMAAIMRRLELVPYQVAVGISAALVD